MIRALMLGMIRLYSQEAAKKLGVVITEMHQNATAGATIDLDTEFASNARERLDNLFG